jgi:hypothetical protein
MQKVETEKECGEKEKGFRWKDVGEIEKDTLGVRQWPSGRWVAEIKDIQPVMIRYWILFFIFLKKVTIYENRLSG